MEQPGDFYTPDEWAFALARLAQARLHRELTREVREAQFAQVLLHTLGRPTDGDHDEVGGDSEAA
jgi:hypothetical protein